MHYKLTARTGLDIVNSPWAARVGTVRGPTRGLRMTTIDVRVEFLHILLRVCESAVWHPCGSHRIWKTFEIPVWGLYDARTGIARGRCGVLRIIISNHKCTAVSSRTGPVAWCDHENSTDVKFLRVLRSALRDRTGGRFKNTYELLNLRALKISKLHKNHIFQCMGKIFCVEFQRVPLKFHTKYLTHTLKDVDFIHIWKFKSSLI